LSQYIINPFFQFGVPPQVTRNSWIEIARKTLVGGETSFVLTPDPFPKKRYLMILLYLTGQADPAVDCELQFNGDTGVNYTNRYSVDGGADSTPATANAVLDIFGYGGLPGVPGFNVYLIDNNPKGEKLVIRHFVSQTASGPGTAPRRMEQVSKWVNALDQISSITFLRTGGGSFASGEAVLLGFDPTDAQDPILNFWQPIVDTPLLVTADVLDTGVFSTKKYLWVEYELVDAIGAIDARMTFNSDTGVKYARRGSQNGGVDATFISLTNIQNSNIVAGKQRLSMFIVNFATKEKLLISNLLEGVAFGPGTIGTRGEQVAKWTDVVSQINRITLNNLGAGNYDVLSKIKIWGHD